MGDKRPDPPIHWATTDRNNVDSSMNFPDGVMGDRCLDWRPIPQNDEDIRLPPKRHLSPLEQEYLLDTHPLFTGHCPQCGAAMPMTDPPPLHWDCDRCGWKDDSI